jgi:hypothetical protein
MLGTLTSRKDFIYVKIPTSTIQPDSQVERLCILFQELLSVIKMLRSRSKLRAGQREARCSYYVFVVRF